MRDNAYSQGGIKAPFYYPYIERKGDPFGADAQAHWLDIVFRLGWVANLEDYRKLGSQVVEDLLASQDPDGYVGVFPACEGLKRKGQESLFPTWFETHMFELWGYGETLNALLRYYRFTGDERVLKACLKAGDWLIDRVGPRMPDVSDYFTNQAWFSSLTDAAVSLYRHSGDPKYRAFAEFILRTFVRYHKYGDWGVILGELVPQPRLKGHTAGWGIVLLSGLQLYRATGDATLLQGLRAANDNIVRENLQPHGAPSGQGEYLAGKGPYLNTELCDVFWFSWVWTELAALTGESQFADLAEVAVCNALPGHRSKDGTVNAYFACPNQLMATKKYHTHYPARLYVECCQYNAPRNLPILVEHMILATSDDGLAVTFYGPSETKVRRKSGDEVILTQETAYPFEEDIRIAVQARHAARFPLLLRIPAWCRGAQIRINGKDVRGEWRSGDWARLERRWGPKDIVEVRLPMQVRVEFWNQQAVTVRRGPLLYALPVQGNQKFYDNGAPSKSS